MNKKIIYKFKGLLVGVIALLFSFLLIAQETEIPMTATGTFEISLEPQQDKGSPAGRMIINKTYKGDIDGTGLGQMLSKRMENGHAVYFAIEEVNATIAGKKGGFTLLHKGVMTPEGQSLSIEIMADSGTGELASISGYCEIEIQDKTHFYTLHYQLSQ